MKINEINFEIDKEELLNALAQQILVNGGYYNRPPQEFWSDLNSNLKHEFRKEIKNFINDNKEFILNKVVNNLQNSLETNPKTKEILKKIIKNFLEC